MVTRKRGNYVPSGKWHLLQVPFLFVYLNDDESVPPCNYFPLKALQSLDEFPRCAIQKLVKVLLGRSEMSSHYYEAVWAWVNCSALSLLAWACLCMAGSTTRTPGDTSALFTQANNSVVVYHPFNYDCCCERGISHGEDDVFNATS